MFPKILENKLLKLQSSYEKEDNTVSSQTMACTGDICEVVDIT